MNVYEIITAEVIRALESGVAPWHKPWRTEPPCNLVSRKEYRGINPFLLMASGHASRYWLTFNQAKQLGGYIKRGEHSSMVTFWRVGDERIVKSADGTEQKKRSFVLRYYRVFNLDQTEGIAEKLGLEENKRNPDLEQCERIVAEMPNAPRVEASNRAWYKPACDTVGIPAKPLFDTAETYYATLFHELTHSTGHPSRVGRDGIENLQAFGSESYSREELIAEMGSAFLCGVSGIAPSTLTNSAAYLNSWIERLRGNSRLVISAASAAQRAADYILGKSTTTDSADSERDSPQESD